MNTFTYLIQTYPKKPWSWYWISRNPNLMLEIIEKHPENFRGRDWEWISCNPNITMEMIEKHPEKPWNWEWISMNPNLTMEIIENNIDQINFDRLSRNDFTFQNNQINKQEAYILLEQERTFHKL